MNKDFTVPHFVETEAVELKVRFSDTIAKEFVAFLNTKGGVVYIGVDDDGHVVGLSNLDETMRRLSDVVTDQIAPSPQGLIKLSAQMIDGKWIIRADVAEGDSLYYIKKFGRSEAGCFERIGTTARALNESQIEQRYVKTLCIPKDSIITLRSPREDLTFNELKLMLVVKKVKFSDSAFNANFKLLSDDGRFNYLAFLLSDQNDTSIKVCRFDGVTKAKFLSRKEFREGCLLRQMQEAFDYSDNVLNLVSTDVTGGRNRIDTRLFDSEAFKEAWFNAVCHNLWTDKVPPAIYGFDDRVEIISHGQLRSDLSLEDFYNGVSKPINQELADCMLKLRLMEQSGKGTSLIVSRYGRDVFHFGTSFVQCILPYSRTVAFGEQFEFSQKATTQKDDPTTRENGLTTRENGLTTRENGLTTRETEAPTRENELITQEGLPPKQLGILRFLSSHPTATKRDVAEWANISVDGVKYHIDQLKSRKLISRQGATKKGIWIVNADLACHQVL